MTVFEAYITNLGKYAEGQLVGETLKFPATTEEVQSLLKNIGVDGVRYEEFFITAFDGDVMGLYDYLTEYENLDELNHIQNGLRHFDFIQYLQYCHGRVRCVSKRHRTGSRDRARLNEHFGGHASRLGGHAGNAGA